MPSAKTLLFYKPDQVLSTFTDESGRETLKNYIPIEGIYSAGRLDFDSEGLLVITADGSLIHRLTDPKNHVMKTYLAQVEGPCSNEKLYELERGVVLGGFKTLPCRVMQVEEPDLPARRKPLTPHAPLSWLRIQIREGKKHQIRKMTAAVGYPCLRLVRVAIGPLGMGDLQPGKWRELNVQEIELLKRSK